MASNTEVLDDGFDDERTIDTSNPHPLPVDGPGPRLPDEVRTILRPLASMKLTVILFALAVWLVFTGTLVQTRVGIWEVMETYFRSWWAFIEFKIFFPPAWIPSLFPKRMHAYLINFPGEKAWLQGFYFPGGYLIGTLMAANLAAAHLLRFTVQAKGKRLLAGLVVIGIGCVATYLVIVGGSNPDGIQGEPFFTWDTLWMLMKLGLAAISMAGVYWAARLPNARVLERRLLQGGSLLLGIGTAVLFYKNRDLQLGNDSMRILWQLIQATLSSVILLAGCILAFKKRAGVVLLHGGVALMMFSELMVSMRAKESQMFIVEGAAENHSSDTRTPELAIIDRSSSKEDKVTAIPKNLLVKDKIIQHPDLPFDIKVVDYFVNSTVRDLLPGETGIATTGRGARQAIVEKPRVDGVSSGGAVDQPAAYIQLNKKGTTESLGTYLTAVPLHPRLESPEELTVDGKKYEIILRFEHIYRPYTIRLNEFRHDKYPGTQVAKDFTSQVTIVDPEKNDEREARIWMNNPLRYRGETFYQSEYAFDPITQKQMTILQVVTNKGWMIPYVSCMIVVVGMLYHFALALLRFMNRRATQAARAKLPVATPVAGGKRRSYNVEPAAPTSDWTSWIIPTAVTLVLALYLINAARMPKPNPEKFNFVKFGQIPVVAHGRLKPIDSLARSSLRVITDREEFTYGEGKDARKVTASEWLLDVMANPQKAAEHKVFRIDMQEVLDLFNLKRVPSLRYSFEELAPRLKEFSKELSTASQLSTNEQDTFQRRLVELARRITVMNRLNAAFQPPEDLPDLPTQEEMQQNPEKARTDLEFLMRFIQMDEEALEKEEAPRIIPGPPVKKSKDEATANALSNWKPYRTAFTKSLILAKVGADPDPTTVNFYGILNAYREGKVADFNKQVDQYLQRLQDKPPEGLDLKRTNFEAFFNHFAPFYHLCILYILAFVITIAAWLGFPRTLNRTAMLLAILGFAVHTWAIYARISISGRPPVTNLYTTAIFIGWGAILLGIAFEVLFKHGIGNLISSVAGYSTLFIAHNLASDGNADTFGVLVAVLDTQFWLATHVVTINLGYATTFVAGCLGVIYIVRGVLTPYFSESQAKDVVRMMYGTLCFGLLFSFFGTVLGGLWGDVSWGRFWGWDPKENGALLIVLWTALILHARWDGFVKDRGFAVLCVGGNIWTAWSWFGVNQLGVGLHSYGTTEGTLPKLAAFFASQFLIMGLGMLPKAAWWSIAAREPQAPLAPTRTTVS